MRLIDCVFFFQAEDGIRDAQESRGLGDVYKRQTVEHEDRQTSNLTLNDGEEVGDGGEGARGGRPLAKALGGRAHYLLQAADVRL